jgi:hypothetical protein
MEAIPVAGASKVLPAMRNPFVKPQTTEQWLSSSVCWTVGSITLWWLITYIVTISKIRSAESIDLLSFITYMPICLLVWWKGVAHGVEWVQIVPPNKVWLKMSAATWLTLLIAFQIVAFLMDVICIVLAYNVWYENSHIFYS